MDRLRRTPPPALLLAAVLLLLVTTSAAFAANVTISATGDGYYTTAQFSPRTVTIHPGDTVTFVNASVTEAYVGMHNVHSDDNSFVCSDTCTAPNNQPSTQGWSFTHTYTTAGSFNFHCDMHGGAGLVGMSGTVNVVAASTPGNFTFSASTYSAATTAASATITVDRTGGSTGAVTVHFATSNGTAHAGTDYTAASGTLNWADGDATAKTFPVSILHAGGGSVNLALSAPSGGAALGSPSTATLNLTAQASNGTLAFAQTSPTVSEAAGSIGIQVNRTAGSSGAVSVSYATGGGTAVAGTNYTSASGTLNWSSGDASPKSFNVPVLDDHSADGSHTVNLTLSNPTGGAALGTAAATLTITDADSGGSAPTAPSNLVATPVDTGSISLTWTLNSTSQTGLQIQSRTLDGAYATLGSGPGATATAFTVSGLAPATGYAFHIAATNGSGVSPYSNEAVASTDATPATCVPSAQTLCLGDNGRFQVQVAFVSGSGSGPATAVPLTTNPDSGLFFFFDSGNIEMLIKVLNACAPPFNHYWVFFAATTNVQFTVTVTDTKTGSVQTYFNPLNQAALPVQDTNAFATCP